MSENILNSSNEEQISSKNDIIKARREARRRKILENASSRLEKICGRSITSTTDNPDIISNFDIINHNNVAPSKNLVIDSSPIIEPPLHKINELLNQEEILELVNKFAKLTETSTTNDDRIDSSTASGNLLENEELTEKQYKTNALIVKVINLRLHLLILSIVVYILFLSNGYFSSLSVFLPLFVFELIEFLLIKKTIYQQKPSLPLLNITLMLAGISPKQSKIIVTLLTIKMKLMKDVSVYVFSFIMTHLLVINLFAVNYNHDENLNVVNSEL